jgi:hypothetical protein
MVKNHLIWLDLSNTFNKSVSQNLDKYIDKFIRVMR